jgi:Fe-S oxidoreductase
MPRLADEPFTAWFRRRVRRHAGEDRPVVLLWPDTFNNYFHPGTARAAVEVLEAAGFEVTVPSRPLCCGRPLYDYGMLDRAKRALLEIVEVLRPSIRARTPVVVLEPSCLAVFRDELVALLPEDEDARMLASSTFSLAEFLSDSEPPALARRVIVHGHCHHKAVIGMAAETSLLARLGVDFDILDSGCCGMAGSFGFESEHYAISLACGELALLPAVRAADAQTLVVADGFSCRQQIAHATDRRGLHLAELLRMPSGIHPRG